ncbi:MAG: hypothetical protein U0Q18_13100 [Bryobacteraceae bacterium]
MSRYLWVVCLAGTALAQTAPVEWRRIGNTAVEIGLASPATGPVLAVWYSADGSRLFARTKSGHTFETADFENWAPSQSASDPVVSSGSPVNRVPEAGAKLVSSTAAPERVYALGNQLYRSDDAGRSWSNLTGFRDQSVIGSGQHGMAISPFDPDQLVIANDFGVWRSMDGGLSWSGLNQTLPNLAASRIVSTPGNGAGARILIRDLGSAELPVGSSQAWQPVAGPQATPEDLAMRSASQVLGAAITAIASVAQTRYAGSADGHIWVSQDAGKTWTASPRPGTNGPIERIFADPVEPRVALAAVGGNGPHVLRTTNNGGFWDDLTANLPDAPVHGITADRASGAIYVASDKGVFFGSADLENPSTVVVSWHSISSRLPSTTATDVRLDANGYQLYVSLDGYGVYAGLAPHRTRALRLVNAADYSTRAAAPGSLISVQGGKVSAAAAGSLTFPILAASDAESQIQVPFEASAASLSLALDTGKGRFTLGLPVQAVSPAIFINRDGSPMILDADRGLMLDGHNIAHSNSRIQILATGLGRVRPDWPTGVAAPLENAPVVAANVKAYVDRLPVQVIKAALAPGYIGFYLIEVQLPAIVNAGPAELYVTTDGLESNRVQIVLEP